MDLIVNNPFAPVLAACLAAALILAGAARFAKLRLAATLAPPVIFLVGYVATYQKIPPFPPVGASNKVFYVALVATLGAAALDVVGRFRRSVLAGASSLLAAVWIGWTKLANPDAATLVLFAALVVGGGLALWGLDRLATLSAPFGSGANALAGLAAVSALSAPTLLFGGSSTGVGLCLGLAAGAAVLSVEALGARRGLQPAAMLGAGGGLVAALDTIALVTRRADPFAMALIALAPFLGPWAVRLLSPALRKRPAVAWIVSGLAVLSPLPVIVALLLLRHDNPLGS
ncbi:hypothetical protein [Roseiarcus sp.]|uniref:hypothetical protein n=1 Tax=Roseiarcus sp. TaxID=1969460 RepID=UPI003F9B406B